MTEQADDGAEDKLLFLPGLEPMQTTLGASGLLMSRVRSFAGQQVINALARPE